MEMVHAILDAAIIVIEREGALAFSTNRVCEVAGVSPGSLYQYFANKEMVLAAVIERGVLDVEDTMRAALDHAAEHTPAELFRALLDELLDALEPYGALLQEVLTSTPVLAETGLGAQVETRLMDLVRDYIVRTPHPVRLKRGPAGLYVAANGMIYVFLKWLAERPRFITRADLIDALVGMLGAAIEIPGAEG